MRAVTAEEIRKIAGGLVVHGAALPRARSNFKKPLAPSSDGMAQPDVIKAPSGGGIGISSGGGGYGGGYGGSGGYGSGGGSGSYYGASGSSGDGGTLPPITVPPTPITETITVTAAYYVGDQTVTYETVTTNGTTTNTSFDTITGDHPDRDNDPIDLAPGPFSTAEGAIGTDDGGGNHVAIFPTAQAGWDAATHDVTDQYDKGNTSVKSLTDTLAPQYDNQGNEINPYTPQHIQEIDGAMGVTATQKLTTSQLSQYTELFARDSEGYRGAGPSE